MWLTDLLRPDPEPDEPRAAPTIAPGKRSLTASLPPRPVGGAASPWAAAARDDDGGLPLVGTLAPPRTGGAPLPADVRDRLEASFGFELSGVRVHQDGSADRLGARALNRGTDLHFAAGEYAPSTADGFALVAHEVAHIAQTALGQAPPAVRAKVDRLLVASALESEADEMAARAVNGRPAWSGAGGGLRPLPALDGPVLAKLKVGGQWVAAEAVAKEVLRQGADEHVIAILERWARDSLPRDDYEDWRQAIAAARAHDSKAGSGGTASAADEKTAPQVRNRFGDHTIDVKESADARAPESKLHGPTRSGRGGRLLVLVTVILLLLGVVAMLASQYDIRRSFDGTASVHRRPLEPVMQQAARLQSLESDPQFQHLRAHLGHGNDPALHTPETEEALQAIEPILQPLEPMVDQVLPHLQTMVHGQLGVHDLQNPANVGLFHEQIMLPSGSNVGRFPDGVHGDRPELEAKYGPAVEHYDADLMEQAITAALDHPQDYRGVRDNCQDFVSDVIDAYRGLGGHEVVLARDVVMVAVTDLLIAGAGGYLDRQVDAAVQSELAASAAAAPPSQCAHDLAARLGLDDAAMGPALDAVLDQQVDLPTGRMLLRDALCGDPTVRDGALAAASSALDTEVQVPHDEKASVRATLCHPKGDSTVMQGVLFELVNARFGARIREQIPAFIAANAAAARRLVSDLTRRLADNLFRRLNLRGLC